MTAFYTALCFIETLFPYIAIVALLIAAPSLAVATTNGIQYAEGNKEKVKKIIIFGCIGIVFLALAVVSSTCFRELISTNYAGSLFKLMGYLGVAVGVVTFIVKKIQKEDLKTIFTSNVMVTALIMLVLGFIGGIIL